MITESPGSKKCHAKIQSELSKQDAQNNGSNFRISVLFRFVQAVIK
jgi:hypothetical protein